MEYTRQHAEMVINEKYGANAPYIVNMSESQTYTYTADPEGSTYVCRWSDKRNRYIWNGQTVINGRHEYYDYSF